MSLPGVAGMAGFSGQAASPAIEYVGGVAANWANTTSPNLDLTALTGGSGAAAAAGDLVLVFFVISDVTTGTPANPSIVSSGYTAINAILSQSDTNRSKLGSWYKFMGGTPDTIVDLGDMTGDQSAVAIARVYRYVNTTTPFDGVAVATAGGTNSGQPNPASCTPATQGAALLIAAGASANNNLTSAEVVGELDAYQGATAGHSGSGLLTGHALNCTAGVPIDPTTSGGSSNGNDCWNALTFVLRPA